MNYKQTYNGPSKVDYAVPTDFRSTFSVGLQTRPKKVGSETRDNVKSELKLVTRTLVEKPENCSDCSLDYDYISVGLSISGSVNNKVAVAKAVQQLFANYELPKDDILSGFINRTVEMPIVG